VRDHFPLAAVVMHHDITALKRAEEDRHRFSAAMEAFPDGIRFVDREQMRIIHANEAACRMHEMKLEQVLALNPWEVSKMTRAELESLYDRLIAAAGSDETQLSLLSLRNRDGSRCGAAHCASADGGRSLPWIAT
jgi:PAS domain S-box-containing protein